MREMKEGGGGEGDNVPLELCVCKSFGNFSFYITV